MGVDIPSFEWLKHSTWPDKRISEDEDVMLDIYRRVDEMSKETGKLSRDIYDLSEILKDALEANRE